MDETNTQDDSDDSDDSDSDDSNDFDKSLHVEGIPGSFGDFEARDPDDQRYLIRTRPTTSNATGSEAINNRKVAIHHSI